MWDPKDKPPVSLEEAIVLAKKQLKPKGDYYCLGATISKSFTEGDWELMMACGKKSTYVSVGSDKSIHVSEEGFRY